MIDYVNNWLSQHANREHVAPSIQCRSGLSLSVQASSSHYCSPKSLVGPYTLVEVGFPHRDGVETRLRTSADRYDGYGVYGYVDVAAVNRIIHRNGGLA